MERPIFNKFANVKMTPEVAEKFKTLEPTQKQVESTNYLTVLQSKHVYAGTANLNEVVKRRAKNKIASKSRKKNRKG